MSSTSPIQAGLALAPAGLARKTFRAHPAPVAGLLLLACALAWAAGLALTHQTPPLDSAEQLVWAYALEHGYWKHPPLPSWIMHGLVGLVGPSVALPYFAAQLSVAVALLVLWRLGCEFMSPGRSLAAAALTGLVGYHGWFANAYNHNSALLPFQAGTMLFFYLAVRRGHWHLWALAGLCAGLAMLVKYVALLPLAALLLYLVLDRQARTLRNLAGLGLAGAIAGLVIAPHLAWLHANGYLPLRYARSVAVPLQGAGDWMVNLARFGREQAIVLLPFLLVLTAMVRVTRRGGGVPEAAPAARDRLFLWTVGVTPVLLIVLWGVATRTEILPRWGSTAFLLAGWLAVDATRWPQRRLRQLLVVLAIAHATLWIGTVVALPSLAQAAGWQGRPNFPGRDVAQKARAVWTAHTGQPLRIVVSDSWLGGTLAAYHGRPLAVLIDGEPARSPWVTPGDLEACGALVVLDPAFALRDALPGVRRYLQAAPVRGEWTIAWAPWRGLKRQHGETSRIEWGVIPPSAGKPCTL